MSAGDGCSQPARSARRDGAVWRRCPRSRGSPARPSVEVSSTSTLRPCRKAGSTSQGWRPAASVEPGRDADRGSAQRHRAGHARRPHAAAVCGCRKATPRWRTRCRSRAMRSAPAAVEETVADARLQPTVEPQGRLWGSAHPDRNGAIGAHQRQGDRRPGLWGSPSSRSMIPRRSELIGNYMRPVAPTIARRRSAAREGARLRGQGVPAAGRTLWRQRRAGATAGWVSVGDHGDTAQFTVASVSAAGSTRWGASATRKPAS